MSVGTRRRTIGAYHDASDEEAPMNRILVATDGSQPSAEAVAFGVELAREQGAEVIFVHVVPAIDMAPVMGFPMVGAVPHQVNGYDRAPLERAVVYAAEHGMPAQSELLTGDTVDEIVAYADSRDVDLIVVGSRGRGAFSTALLGSVSRGILHEARRPVLVVRGEPVRVAPSVSGLPAT
jgi:nucleotide-binding universal stress UspA family protein